MSSKQSTTACLKREPDCYVGQVRRMALAFVDIYQPAVTRKEVERDTITKEQIAQHKTAQQKC